MSEYMLDLMYGLQGKPMGIAKQFADVYEYGTNAFESEES